MKLLYFNITVFVCVSRSLFCPLIAYFPGIQSNFAQVLLPIWHPKVSINWEVSEFSLHAWSHLPAWLTWSKCPPLTTLVCSDRGMEWPCSTLLLFWLTLRDASALVSVASPTAHRRAFAFSGMLLSACLTFILCSTCVFWTKKNDMLFERLPCKY